MVARVSTVDSDSEWALQLATDNIILTTNCSHPLKPIAVTNRHFSLWHCCLHIPRNLTNVNHIEHIQHQGIWWSDMYINNPGSLQSPIAMASIYTRLYIESTCSVHTCWLWSDSCKAMFTILMPLYIVESQVALYRFRSVCLKLPLLCQWSI